MTVRRIKNNKKILKVSPLNKTIIPRILIKNEKFDFNLIKTKPAKFKPDKHAWGKNLLKRMLKTKNIPSRVNLRLASQFSRKRS